MKSAFSQIACRSASEYRRFPVDGTNGPGGRESGRSCDPYPGAHAIANPDKAAVIVADTGGILTYADLEERSLRLAHVLRDAGLKQGDCIAVLAENTPRYFEIYWAAMRCGLYFTALNVYLALDEHLHVIDDSGVEAIFVSAAKAELGARIAEQPPDLTLHASISGQIPGYSDLDELLAEASTEPLADQTAGQDMLYSSGTTGKPGDSCPAARPSSKRAGSPTYCRVRIALWARRRHVYFSPARCIMQRRCGSVR
ncbi:non-ribosomal peptide synthetase component E (peptide arylation enzyme) [Rhodococcus sp. 27YEA6]